MTATIPLRTHSAPRHHFAETRGSLGCEQGIEVRPTSLEAQKFVIGLIAAVTLIGITLRLHFIAHPMRYDESYSYLNFASRSAAQIVSHYVPNNHVLHTLMVHFVAQWIGDSPARLRLPALIAGVLLIPMTGWLAWSLSRRPLAAILASTAACVSSALIEYSTNARGYSWLALFAALQCILTIRAIESARPRRVWLVWAVIGALGAYTVPVMFFWSLSICTAAIFVCLWIDRRNANAAKVITRSVAGLGCCGAMTLVFYAPALVTSGLSGLQATHHMSTEILDRQLPGFADALLAAVQLFLRDGGLLWPIILALGLVVAFVNAVVRRKSALLIPSASIIMFVAAVNALRIPLPARAWLLLWPATLAIASIGATTILDAVMKAPGIATSARTIPRRWSYVAIACGVFYASIVPLVRVWRSQYLCSEPGGLVDVEPAIEECRKCGAEHCAIVSRYTPATAYYLHEKQMADLPLPSSLFVTRIFIVAEDARELDRLWNDRVAGYTNYSAPVLTPSAPRQPMYVADRREVSCDKYLARSPEARH